MASSIDGVVWRGLLALVLALSQLQATARAASVALVVPLHPPRYDQAAGLVSSYVQHNLSASLDVYFVLAQSDLGSFGEALGYYPPVSLYYRLEVTKHLRKAGRFSTRNGGLLSTSWSGLHTTSFSG